MKKVRKLRPKKSFKAKRMSPARQRIINKVRKKVVQEANRKLL